ncbi:MAG: hypothetical protein V3U60_11335 [Gammaproteobacteria bacterium]
MTDLILWLLYLTVGSWLILGGTIFAYPTVVRLKDQRHEFSWVVIIPIFLFAVAGAIADIIFNALIGTWIFKELPRLEFRWQWAFIKFELFTDRLKRHHYGDSQKQKDRAAIWVWRVNMIDPGHV